MTFTPRRIWLHRRSALGDVLLALPIATLLAERHPHSRPTLVTHTRLVPLLSRAPTVDATDQWPMPTTSGDIHVDLQRPGWSAALWGRRGLPSGSLLDPVRRGLGRPTQHDRRHTLTRYAAAVGLGPLTLPVALKPGPLLAVEPDRGEDSSTVLRIGVAAGASHPTKAPTPEMLGWLLATLVRTSRRPLRPVWLGGPGDKRSCHQVTQVGSWRHAAHRHQGLKPDSRALFADPLGLARIIAGCDRVISGDTGPAHLAQILDVPTLVLFGPTSVQRWGPWRASASMFTASAPCSPCSGHGQKRCRHGHRACLTRLYPTLLQRAALQLLDLRAEEYIRVKAGPDNISSPQ
ncbi:MAG: glycosyltransferase family 9 protein [Myxococcota bacterium]